MAEPSGTDHDDDLLSTRPGTGSLDPVPLVRSDAATWSLDGTWWLRVFERPDLVPPGVGDDGVHDDADWDEVQVPGHWVLQGHGAPAYTNVQYPFPVDPPFVPDDNPVGVHRRAFDLDRIPGSAVLRLDGVDSAGTVWLNGRRLGTTRGSRLPTSFDVSGLLREHNTVVVAVAQWSAASYLEDQDMWWLPGIPRSIAVVETPVDGLGTVRLHADYDPATGTGTLRVQAGTTPAVADRCRVAVPELGVTGLRVDEEIGLGPVEPWSADRPRLYDVVVSAPGESATLRAGFRRVHVDEGRWMVNGRPLLLRGVNRHEHHPDLGRVVPYEVLREDLLLMKRHNVDAVRTSHYPPHADLLDLADELGLWVIVEADLETHGFELVGWRRNPSDEPAWREAYLDRIERTVLRDVNHPCVIAWSLGNEAGTGANLAAAADRARALDPSRPVHYEGDHDAAYVDVWSAMYTSPDEVELIGRREEAPLDDPAADARRRAMPFLLCEYAHAMGTGPGGLSRYQELFETHPRLAGGFVWEWVEHGLRQRRPDGTSRIAYGGDFGERVHDGSFVIDGLVSADREPRPGLVDLKQVFAPVRLRVDDDDGTGVEIHNLFHARDTTGLTLRWSAEGCVPALGVVPLPVVAAGETVRVELPALAAAVARLRARPDSELVVVTLAVETAHPLPWAPVGHELAWAQQVTGVLVHPAPQGRGRPVPRDRPGTLALGAATLDASTGRLLRAGPFEVGAGVDLALWRAPTDNDEGSLWEREGDDERSQADLWREAGLDRLVARLVAVEAEPGRLRQVRRYAPAGADHAVDLSLTWTADDDPARTVLDVAVDPVGPWTQPWPRIGLALTLLGDVASVRWLGLGPGPAYPDTGQGARLGRFESTVEDLQVPLVRPQENGSRAGVHRVELTAPEGALTVHAPTPPGLAFSVRPWSDADLTRATHLEDLVPSPDRRHLHLDLAQHGIGTASCGPGVDPAHRLDPAPLRRRLLLDSLRPPDAP